ncbi:DUF6302 family protein [Streptomyces sp. BA2]|uniref:DUF6302 family protein n=1 Tax=Streptomyces sp. BA2 TaxID=436595 RepID=UPI0013229C8B|nr:hypothetical protein [Streptomyces sp. BA2]
MRVVVIQAPRKAYDFEYYEQRLADTWLLEKSLALRTLRMPFLAVPVGGTRRGGYYPVSCFCIALRVRDVLLGRHGFPDPRVNWSTDPNAHGVVEWGERHPWLSDEDVLGRFYGYSDAAIARDKTRRADTAPAPQTPCSVFYPFRSPAAQ